jgi:SAM-dependent methyltransferase
MIKKEKTLFDMFVCPKCHDTLEVRASFEEDGEVKEGELICNNCNCSSVFLVRNFIAMLIGDGSEIKREGVAINLKNAVTVFKKEIDPDSRVSGRLFDSYLNDTQSIFLDIGCGIGRHLLILRNNGIRRFMGFDIVCDCVEIARSEFGLRNVFVANALSIPFANSTVDRCFLYDSIEHCSDPAKVLREVNRVLTRGGILFMNAPNGNSMGDRFFRWGGKIIYGKTSHIQKFTKRKLQSMVEGAGFRIMECKVQHGIFVDYLQFEKFSGFKKILTFLFGNEVSGWELRLQKD